MSHGYYSIKCFVRTEDARRALRRADCAVKGVETEDGQHRHVCRQERSQSAVIDIDDPDPGTVAIAIHADAFMRTSEELKLASVLSSIATKEIARCELDAHGLLLCLPRLNGWVSVRRIFNKMHLWQDGMKASTAVEANPRPRSISVQ